jgi:DNA-binding MarR family transcriptional regulator
VVTASAAASTDPRRALSPELDTVRRIFLDMNCIGREITRAIVDAGLGEWSSNGAIVVLSTLSLDGPARPRALIGPTKLTRGGLSNLLERLEVAGLVTRQYGVVPGDRRGAVVTITEKGKSTLTAINDLASRSADQQRHTFDELTALLRAGHWNESASVCEPASVQITERWLELIARLGGELEVALAAATLGDPMPARSVIALCCAASAGGTWPSELIDQTGLSSGGVSQLLDRIEHDGLIQRRTGLPPDRRVVFVELTEKGRAELERRLRRGHLHRGDHVHPGVAVGHCSRGAVDLAQRRTRLARTRRCTPHRRRTDSDRHR